MDTSQSPQEIVVKPREDTLTNTACPKPKALDKKPRPHKDQALNCPRCNSTNTKFCYYNNYSLTQPRYFCKTCRRYWTEGGTLRTIPVGGGSRKNKRSSSSSSSTSSLSSKKFHDLVAPPKSPKNIIHHGQDLNLTFPFTQDTENIFHVPSDNNNKNNSFYTSCALPTSTSQFSALEMINGMNSSRGLSSFMSMQVPDPSTTCYTSEFPQQEFKPTLNFTLDGLGNSYGDNIEGVQGSTGNGRNLFPYEDLKQVSSTSEVEETKAQGDSTGYWTRMLGGGSW